MNKKPEKTPMREQDITERIKNFSEVPLGYSEQEAHREAERCLQCSHKPCESGCPVEVPIPDFIAALRDGNYEKAARAMLKKNYLPAICGRVCPQAEQCEARCVLGKQHEPVAIGRLERFLGDWIMEQEEDFRESPLNPEKNKDTAFRAAVVGSGPAGLTCAAELAAFGCRVTIFEAFHEAGGVLKYGIPEFRLPGEVVSREVEAIAGQGVEIKTNCIIGKTLTIDELFDQDFDTVFIGSGAGLPRFLNIPGENLAGVYTANEFLTRINLMKAFKFPEYKTPVRLGNRVAVVGGGNVAMDAARSAKRLDTEKVYLIYRRTEEYMPARREEIEHAREEGIEFMVLNSPRRIIGKEGQVRAVECIEMELGEEDDSGRPRPVPKPGSEWTLEIDNVIVAIGQTPNPLLAQNTPDLKTEEWGGIKVDDRLETTRSGVFAGGDAVTGTATVIQAMGAGKKAAQSMIEYMKNS